MITDLFKVRAKLLGLEHNSIGEITLAGGRLLICFPDESVWDGASEAESMDFINVVDLPAWDTWCYYGIAERSVWESSESYDFIISWVPPNFVELVEAGIYVNPVDCIRWATEVEEKFKRTTQ